MQIQVRTNRDEEVDAYDYEWQEWREYLNAASLKVDIACYHNEELLALLAREGKNREPSTAVQAHFEGVLYSFVAASDQVAEAIVLDFRLSPESPNPGLQDALEAMPRIRLCSKLFAWQAGLDRSRC